MEGRQAGFTDKTIKAFDVAGVLSQATPIGNLGRGVYRLGNGNLLTSGYAKEVLNKRDELSENIAIIEKPYLMIELAMRLAEVFEKRQE